MLVIEKLVEDIKNIDDSKLSTDCELYKMLRKENDTKNCCDNCDVCLKNSLIMLAQEHKEPIELTKFEFDLLKTIEKYNKARRFKEYIFTDMKMEKGYFKGIKDISMTIEEILENCVVKDDAH